MASSSTQTALASSPPPSAPGRWNYDVFLSFRGEDTRKNFVDHLYTALKNKGINRVFRDDQELERGREISPKLVKAIEESRFSIIVFSENYATSRWCLDELVKIINCTKETGHVALPIFYNVDPSNVRKQRGSFAEAFAKHEKAGFIEDMEKVQRWRAALSQAANLCGWDSRDRHESKFIQEIAEEMFYKLNQASLQVDNNLVGIDFHLKEMTTRLTTESDDVKFVGIYGLGGIGKTTIAKSVFNIFSSQFEGRSYLANIREISEKNGGLVSLQEQLLYNILNVKDLMCDSDMVSVIKNCLGHKRVLVILDDVDHLNQLEELAGKHDWFGPGSRIIITTRDEHLLDAHGVVERYKVRELSRDESLKLFSLKAFKQNHPLEDFSEISNNVVNYAKGLPLALKVLGSFLCGRNKTAWNGTLDKLNKVPNKEITDILKISYDGLEQTDKDIFLDIACFFKGKDKEHVTKILDRCGFFASIGIQVLNDRSLISFSDNNELLMHDLVQDMGRDIVRQESPKDPSKRSRLWLYQDIRSVLMNNDGTNVVEAIMLEDLPRPGDFEVRPEEVDLRLTAKAFVKMYNLRLLKIHGVHLPQGLSNLPDKLRIVHWQECPLVYLPTSFQPGKLVELSMQSSRIEQLWNGIKVLDNLISIDLSWCNYLTEVPDLTGAPILEQLILDGCRKLSALHPSVGSHRRLKYLSLRSCTNLRSLPSRIELESLETLDLHGCTKLEKLPKLLGNMECLSKLNLERTAIREVPSSIEKIIGLKLLTLSYCKNLESLPSSICGLKYLEEFLLDKCSTLEHLPENLGKLESLVKLDVSYTKIKEVPPSIVHLKNLQRLSFERCRATSMDSCGLKLHFSSGLCSLTYLNLSNSNLSDGAIPSNISSLSALETLDLSGNSFVYLPSSVSQLSRLTTFSLIGCKRLRALPELPSSIETINANDCTLMERLSNTSTVFESKNVCFGFINCRELILTDALTQFQHQALCGNSETFSICLPGNSIPGWFRHQNMGSSLGIQLTSNWYNTKLRGLAFCIVADDTMAHVDSFGFNIGADVGGGIIISKNSSPMEISYRGYGDLRHAHVMLGYISRAWLRVNENQLMKASFCFTAEGEEVEVLKCGIRLVYDDDNEKENDQFKRSRSLESLGVPEKALNIGINGTNTLLSDESIDEGHRFKMLRL